MSFDYLKSFDTDNGVTLSEGGPGIFSGTGSPQGIQAPEGSIYYGTDKSIWHKEGPLAIDWKQHDAAGKPRGRDHNNIMTAEKAVLSGAYTTIAKGPIGGANVYPPTVTFTFVVEAKKTSANGDMTVRLYDDTNATELAVVTFTETVDTVKEVSFTLNTGEVIASVQGKKTGSNGTVIAASIVTEW